MKEGFYWIILFPGSMYPEVTIGEWRDGGTMGISAMWKIGSDMELDAGSYRLISKDPLEVPSS